MPAQSLSDIQQRSVEQERRAQEQRQQLEQQQRSPVAVLPTPPARQTQLLLADESPCFVIEALELEGDLQGRFAWLLDHADGHAKLDQPDPVQGKCLGPVGIQQVIDRLQNALIGQGYITSKVAAPPQNLQTGTLKLALLPGRVNAIVWADGSGQRGSRWNTVPIQLGEVLNLRDIEQALENYKRVPTAEADIQIVPASEPGSSDLVIQYRQASPFRLSATADDSGTRSTGKYQGSLTLSYDNWWTLSDLFYLSLLHDLGGADPGARGTKGRTFHYSVPWGHWLISFSSSQNTYHQTVAGANADYLYSGESRNQDIKLTQVIHRDAVGKTQWSVKGFLRQSRNYIDDTEIQVQRRAVAGHEWGLNHRRTWTGGSFEATLNYRRGTGAFGSLPAPEEAFGEGTARMKLALFDATFQQAFDLGGTRYNYSGTWRAQHNYTRLTPQDLFSIGGRFTVRGFDGRSVLSAERGWLLRNDLSTSASSSAQAYGGIDIGQVAGPGASRLVGDQLVGLVLGVRGKWAGTQYDTWIGMPLSQPDPFRTAQVTAGFSLSWSF